VKTYGNNLIKELQSEREVGVAAFGEISRHGSINLISICSSTQNYVFDINEITLKFLKRIFESKSILKVVHNSQILADALYHLHGIMLTNVHDITVFDVILQKKRQKLFRCPRKPKPLIEFIIQDLLEKKIIPPNRNRSGLDKHLPYSFIKCIPDNIPSLMKRPFTNRAINLIKLKSLFLREIRQSQMKELFSEANWICQAFLDSLRYAQGKEYDTIEKTFQEDFSPFFTPNHMKTVNSTQSGVFSRGNHSPKTESWWKEDFKSNSVRSEWAMTFVCLDTCFYIY